MNEKVDIAILMVTACQEDIDEVLGLGLGVDDYIEKPFSPNVLLARIKVHINRLREKIEEKPLNPRYIQRVWGRVSAEGIEIKATA